jgi:hypothetical protein
MDVYIAWGASFVFICIACYMFGESRGFQYMTMPHPAGPPIDFQAQVAATELANSIEQVAFLGVTTSAIDVIRVDPPPAIAAASEVRGADPVVAHDVLDEITAAYAQAARLHDALEKMTESYARAERLRRRYLRLLRVERARLRYMLEPFTTDVRRPSKPKLLAAVIDIGTLAHPARIRVVPQPVAHLWRIAS